MRRYLTNIRKYVGIEKHVSEAAKESGLLVTYVDHQMPPERVGCENCGSICSAESILVDHSAFWRAFEKQQALK